MTNVFVFHGIENVPTDNWYTWLAEELNKAGYSATVPAFPNTNTPNLDEWISHMDQYSDRINEKTFFVGHSLGGQFALDLIETLNTPIQACYLIASVFGIVNNEYDDRMATFAQREFDWDQIKKNCSDFHIFHSNNDPYISLDRPSELAEKLGVQFTVSKNAGHFNAASEYTEFPELLVHIAEHYPA